jgi:biopolymer transport protein TolQ
MVFRRHRRELQQLLTQFRAAKNFSELIAISREHKETMGGRYLMQCLHEIRQVLDKGNKGTEGGDASASLTEKDLEALGFAINQIMDVTILEEETYLPVLSVSAAAAPLIGLFGTIWGLIHAFIDIGQEKSADIATVAPGMAEALIVTLAGLVVAIPALVAFHYFANKLRMFEFTLTQISDIFIKRAKQAFVK